MTTMMKMMRGIRIPATHPVVLNGWPCRIFRTLCTSSSNSGNSKEADIRSYNDAYRQLQNLDFMTAAKMLFTGPPKKKKFGLDFHLVQLFFACMPSLAVYLVAQYARYEMRRMEAEIEQKKKQAEVEEKAKEMQSNTTEEEGSDSELLKVKVRLDALEEAVKEIVDETKKRSTSMAKYHEGSKEEKPTNLQDASKAASSAVDNQQSKSAACESTPATAGTKVQDSNTTTSVSHENQMQDGKTGNCTSHDSKK